MNYIGDIVQDPNGCMLYSKRGWLRFDNDELPELQEVLNE